jgi:hypothetical protein
MTREEWLIQVLDATKVHFHWICTIEDQEIREAFQKEMLEGNLFIFSPAMFVYCKDEEGKWKRGELWFNAENPTLNAIAPVTVTRIGAKVEDIVRPCTKEELNEAYRDSEVEGMEVAKGKEVQGGEVA